MLSREDPPRPSEGSFDASCSELPANLVAALRPALAELAKAHHYARLAQRNCWEFAIRRSTLRAFGLTDTELRWLSCQGYVLGAREVTQPEDEARSYRPSHNLSFDKRTCFVLTDAGESFVCSQSESLATRGRASVPAPEATATLSAAESGSVAAPIPVWDAARRELRYLGRIVKRYRVPARNQALILTAFQEDGWPEYIEDPLPPAGEQDPKHRLQATVKSLNRNQQAAVIRFHGNGNGLQVFWEAIEAD